MVLKDLFSSEATAGVDQAFLGEGVISGVVVLDSSLRLLNSSECALRATLPYIPGFLSLRKGAPAIKAVRCLNPMPSLLFVDGCGINHLRRAGLASFVGVMLGMPTIGIRKNALCGQFDALGRDGEASPLIQEGEIAGYVLASRKACCPAVAAPGHLISADSALEEVRRYL